MKYSKEHVWVRQEGEVLRIGLSDYAQAELGELTFIEFPDIGSNFAANSAICSIDSLKAASDVYAPVSGTVVEVNAALKGADGASLVNRSPLDDGWLLVLRPDANADADADSLLSEEAYLDFIKG